MSLRSQPFSGSGRVSPEAVRKLNALMNRSEMFSGNSTSPMTRTPTGTIAQYRRRIAYQEESSSLMFKVASFTTTTMTIRAGVCCTWSAGVEHDVAASISGGTSMDPNDTVVITGITASCWIIGTVDNADNPTTLVLSKTGSTAFPADNSNLKLPIALVTCAGSVIVDYYQAHNGPWFRFRGGSVAYDDLSINLNTDLELQDKGWETAVSNNSMANTDLIMYQGYGGGANPLAKNYISILAFLNVIGPWMIGAGGPWETLPWPDTHAELLDIVAGTCGDHHDGSLIAGNFPYISGARVFSDDGQAFMAGGGLGDAVKALSVDPAARTLSDGTNARLKWDSTPQLLLDWEGTGALTLSAAADITPGTHASGDLRVAGGASLAKRVQIESAEAGNISSNTGALRVTGGATFGARTVAATGAVYCIIGDTTSALEAGDGTRTVGLCNGTYAVEATAGGINCNASAAYNHGGVNGATVTAKKLRIPCDDGSTWEGYIRGGILCAT